MTIKSLPEEILYIKDWFLRESELPSSEKTYLEEEIRKINPEENFEYFKSKYMIFLLTESKYAVINLTNGNEEIRKEVQGVSDLFWIWNDTWVKPDQEKWDKVRDTTVLDTYDSSLRYTTGSSSLRYVIGSLFYTISVAVYAASSIVPFSTDYISVIYWAVRASEESGIPRSEVLTEYSRHFIDLLQRAGTYTLEEFDRMKERG